MSILGTRLHPGASQGGGTQAQRMRQEGPPQLRVQSPAIGSTQGLSLFFPQRGLLGSPGAAHPTPHLDIQVGPQELG